MRCSEYLQARQMKKLKRHTESLPKSTDSPLADVAEQKMKEVNEAYDEINKMRQKGKGTGSQSAGGYNSYNSYNAQNSKYYSVRIYIQRNMINEAERILNEAPISERDAEWNFLMGMCAYRRGFNEQANTYFNTACNMDPNNAEYRTAVNNMNNDKPERKLDRLFSL